MKPKKSGIMISAEISNHTSEVLSRQIILKKSFSRMHAHSHIVLGKKKTTKKTTIISFWSKKKF